MPDFPAKTAAVIGFGRFGRLWASILRDDCEVLVHDPAPESAEVAAAQGFTPASLEAALAADVVFYCVPISAFEATLQEHLPYFAVQAGPRTLIDTLSVKVHPREVFDRHLPSTYQAMLTHPMFGPDLRVSRLPARHASAAHPSLFSTPPTSSAASSGGTSPTRAHPPLNASCTMGGTPSAA